jgi:DNA polymerase-3 subunit beta
MQFTITREVLNKPLQRVASVLGSVEKRQTLPILGNILVVVKNQLLSLTGTDLETEIVARIPLQSTAVAGSITISGKKLMDICKSLPESASISFEYAQDKVLLRSGRSRYALACLPAENFPRIEEGVGEVEVSVSQGLLRQLFDATSFAMAHQDVRYYLNGVCLILSAQEIRMVATDGHRLVTMRLPLHSHLEQPLSFILPRKAVLEMQRLFAEGDEEIGLVIGKNHLRAVTTQTSFITKLIEGKFPDYHRVLSGTAEGQFMRVPREQLRQALLRVSALFTDKYRGVGLQITPNLLRIVAVTPDKDEVEDELEIDYQGPALEIGLNSNYLIEYLHIIRTEMVKVTFTNPDQAVLFEGEDPSTPLGQHAYVVMPMRL